MSKFIPEEWLKQTNKDMREEGIPHIRRPFEAMTRWSTQRNSQFVMPSQEANELFAWFEEHSPPGSHHVGACFVGTYFFDSYFWKVDIPVAYGSVKLDPLQALSGMPSDFRSQLVQETSRFVDYVCVWTDTLDYALGIADIGYGKHLAKPVELASRLLASGDKELRATVDLLIRGRQPSSKAAETARLSTEIFLKAYLVLNEGHSEDRLRKQFGHNLSKALQACMNWSYQPEFVHLAKRINAFPPVEARYQGAESTSQLLWFLYGTALLAATTVIRSLSGRDTRPQIAEQLVSR